MKFHFLLSFCNPVARITSYLCIVKNALWNMNIITKEERSGKV